MKLFKNHKARVEKVQNFAVKNKVFMIMAAVAVAFLLINFVFNQKSTPPYEAESTAVAEVEVEPLPWRFYWIDVAVLGVGGGVCTVMILRERKKAKEELN